jgi:hypothetical protein
MSADLEKQASGIAGERTEIHPTIKRYRSIVLGLDEQRKDREFCSTRAFDSVVDHRGAETEAPGVLVHGKPTDQRGGKRRIPWQTPLGVLIKIIRPNLGRGERVVSCNRRIIEVAAHYETTRQPAAGILSDLLAEVAVKWFNAATEFCTVVVLPKKLDDEWRQRDSLINLRWAAAALSRPGPGFGGLAKAS